MNTRSRRVVLAATTVLGLYVGVWAAFLRRSFYDHFPGFGRQWISPLGPYHEHLISDVGAAHLALTAITVVGLVHRRAGAGRLAGLGWTVFGVLHLIFHSSHLVGDTVDRVGTLVSLGISAALGLALLVLPVAPLPEPAAAGATT